MLLTTVDVIRTVLKTDPSVSALDRARLLALLRSGPPPDAPAPAAAEPRILTRAQAAARLGRSVRLIDSLAAAGHLTRIRLPGRKLAAGFREDEILQLISGRGDK